MSSVDGDNILSLLVISPSIYLLKSLLSLNRTETLENNNFKTIRHKYHVFKLSNCFRTKKIILWYILHIAFYQCIWA